MAWAYRLIVLVLALSPVLGQDFNQNPFIIPDGTTRASQLQPLAAEDRIRGFQERGDLAGLADYTLELVQVARGQRAAIDRQAELIADLDRRRTEIAAGIDRAVDQFIQVKEALAAERAERDKMLSMINSLNKPSWRRQLESAGLGATLGGNIGRNVGSALVGTAVGWFIEWVSSRNGKP